MGRELRRVPPDWNHPVDDDGDPIPLYPTSYAVAARRWMDEAILWDRGEHPDQADDPDLRDQYFYWEWADNPPDKEQHMPEWPAGEATSYQVYENVTEGKPISPVFATTDEVVAWLVAEEGDTPERAAGWVQQELAPLRRDER